MAICPSPPLTGFLSTGTILVTPGFTSVWAPPEIPYPPPAPPVNGSLNDGAKLAVTIGPMPSTRAPQPIRYPASNVEPVSLAPPPPSTLPMKVPPTTYSRDANDVVSGATATNDSFSARTVRFHLSGAARKPASPEGQLPLSGGGDSPAATGGGGSGSGSAATGDAAT